MVNPSGRGRGRGRGAPGGPGRGSHRNAGSTKPVANGDEGKDNMAGPSTAADLIKAKYKRKPGRPPNAAKRAAQSPGTNRNGHAQVSSSRSSTQGHTGPSAAATNNVSSSSCCCCCMAPSCMKTSSTDGPHGPDLSVVGEVYNQSKRGARQILDTIRDGTPEIKDLLFNECELIFECRICRQLFRSAINFLSHKRSFCRQHVCERMVLFDETTLVSYNEAMFEDPPESNVPPTAATASAASASDQANTTETESSLTASKEIPSVAMSKAETVADSIKQQPEPDEIRIVETVKEVRSKNLNFLVGRLAAKRAMPVYPPSQPLNLGLRPIGTNPNAVFQERLALPPVDPVQTDQATSQASSPAPASPKPSVADSAPKAVTRPVGRPRKTSHQPGQEGTTEGPIICDLCGSELGSKKTLAVHMKTIHGPGYTFTCPLCNHTFTQLGNARRHLITKHNKKGKVELKKLCRLIKSEAVPNPDNASTGNSGSNEIDQADDADMEEDDDIDELDQATPSTSSALNEQASISPGKRRRVLSDTTGLNDHKSPERLPHKRRLTDIDLGDEPFAYVIDNQPPAQIRLDEETEKSLQEQRIVNWSNLRCNLCTSAGTFSSAYNLQLHAVTHLDLEVFKCKGCPFRSVYRWDMEQHLGNEHSIGEAQRPKMYVNLSRPLAQPPLGIGTSPVEATRRSSLEHDQPSHSSLSVDRPLSTTPPPALIRSLSATGVIQQPRIDLSPLETSRCHDSNNNRHVIWKPPPSLAAAPASSEEQPVAKPVLDIPPPPLYKPLTAPFNDPILNTKPLRSPPLIPAPSIVPTSPGIDTTPASSPAEDTVKKDSPSSLSKDEGENGADLMSPLYSPVSHTPSTPSEAPENIGDEKSSDISSKVDQEFTAALESLESQILNSDSSELFGGIEKNLKPAQLGNSESTSDQQDQSNLYEQISDFTVEDRCVESDLEEPEESQNNDPDQLMSAESPPPSSSVPIPTGQVKSMSSSPLCSDSEDQHLAAEDAQNEADADAVSDHFLSSPTFNEATSDDAIPISLPISVSTSSSSSERRPPPRLASWSTLTKPVIPNTGTDTSPTQAHNHIKLKLTRAKDSAKKKDSYVVSKFEEF